MVCYFCINTLAEKKFPNCLRIEPSFINTNVGFYNWKKAIEKSTEHRNSKQHKTAPEIQLFAKKQSAISCQLDTAVMKSQEEWRNLLPKVITRIKFLCESGLPVRGHNSNTGLFHELLKLHCMICADSTTDITGQEQLIIIIKSVSPDFNVHEYFLSMVTMSSTTGKRIADTISLNIDICHCRG